MANPEIILPLNCVVGAVTWPIETQVIHWAHTSSGGQTDQRCDPAKVLVARPGSGREGIHHRVCAQKKKTLPVLSRPWSDISLDFVTGLPASSSFKSREGVECPDSLMEEAVPQLAGPGPETLQSPP
ncbi:hypothetical protein JOB18_032356 [Solea senegalensis]|uniref:Uncharacterized protein n=1 Tax=Solea senegalensis TaxID=28829 RepID=A0AAV6Q2D6_SOLSE|nr:hypothetical protein JOB18_032356 [Solea senegalensis]